MNLESWEQSPQQEENQKHKEHVSYHLESGFDVDLTIKEFSPSSQKEKTSGVIFLPGLQMNPGDSLVKGLSEAYAESSNEITYAIKTDLKENKEAVKNNKSTQDLFYEEALAVSRFIKEEGLTNVTLVGYSLGGPKAIDTAYILQKDENIKINGLILLSSPGLYEQEPGQLKKNLTKDSLNTIGKVVREGNSGAFIKGAKAGLSVGSNLFSSLLRTDSRNKVKRDFSEMERINPRLQELEIPIVLVLGVDDQVVEAEKIIPKKEEEIIKGEIEARKNNRLEVELKNETWEDQGSDMTREKYLKENFFNKSPYVRMVTAKKMGKHGLPVFRSEEVAKSSMYLLDRFHRKEGNTSEE